MKFLLLLLTLVSCGRADRGCRNRETMRLECRAVNQPNYGYTTAQRICEETYSSDRCY